MFARVMIVTIAVGLLSPAYPASGRTCSASLSGRWKIVSYKLDPVSAVSDTDAKVNVGKVLSISDKKVVIAATSCVVLKRTISATEDEPGYNESVSYTCAKKIVVPYLYVGKSCDSIIAALDGATYQLQRLSLSKTSL